ncbi:MAG TPA: hypothetical protein DCL55_14600 [Brevundimonas sp.]|nr:hypothetical protein [Brevundimonas sp.]
MDERIKIAAIRFRPREFGDDHMPGEGWKVRETHGCSIRSAIPNATQSRDIKGIVLSVIKPRLPEAMGHIDAAGSVGQPLYIKIGIDMAVRMAAIAGEADPDGPFPEKGGAVKQQPTIKPLLITNGILPYQFGGWVPGYVCHAAGGQPVSLVRPQRQDHAKHQEW